MTKEKIKKLLKKHLSKDMGKNDLKYAENRNLFEKSDIYKEYIEVWEEAQKERDSQWLALLEVDGGINSLEDFERTI